jgi:hypothetical protein
MSAGSVTAGISVAPVAVLAQTPQVNIDLAPLLVVGLIFGVICALIASSKGRSPLGWGVLGFLFPLITLIVILVIKRKQPSYAGPRSYGTPARYTPTPFDDPPPVQPPPQPPAGGTAPPPEGPPLPPPPSA